MEESPSSSPPFWSRGRPRRTISGASNASTSSSAGAAAAVLRPWVLVLLLAVVVVLFVPSYVSTSFRGFRPGLVKNGWHAVNFVLVLFAIMCGVLGRNQEPAGEEAAERPPAAASASSIVQDWYAGYSADLDRRDQGGFRGRGVVGADAPAVGGSKLTRRSSSYPDLREETWASGDGWRFSDDYQLYNHHLRSRRSEGIRAWGETPRDSDFKTIHVDTFVPRSRSPPPVVSSPPEEEPRRSPQKPRRKEAERNRGYDGSEIEEKARVPPSAPPSPPPPPPPPPPPSTPPRRSLEKLPRRDLGQTTSSKRFQAFAKALSPQPTQPPPPRAGTPPPSPPPPPPAFPLREQSRSHRRRSGGAKELKIALAQFYQKKKKKSDKDKRISDDPALSSPSSSPPTATVPPPPPPLSSGFFQRFSSKKGGSKSKRIHSVPAPTPPPPPQPTQSRKHASRPPLPPSTRRSVHRLDSFGPFGFPPPPPPPPPPPTPPRPSVDRLSSSADPTENDTCVSEEAANRKETKDPEGKPKTPLFCPSPDVNTKADVFIARLHAGWRLEKLNSIREKQQQPQLQPPQQPH